MLALASEAVGSKFFFVSLFCVLATAERNLYSIRCEASGAAGVQVLETGDGVPGRYDVEQCIQNNPYIQWEVILSYLEDRNETDCTVYDYESDYYAEVHSQSEIVTFNKTCSQDASMVCFNYTFDLMFGGCYLVSSRLWQTPHYYNQSSSRHYVHNTQTLQTYQQCNMIAEVITNIDTLSIVWLSEPIPITSYTVKLCRQNFTTLQECTFIQDKCHVDHFYKLECIIPKVTGSYLAIIENSNDVAWTHGMLKTKRTFQKKFIVSGEEPGGGRVWSAAAVAGAAAAAAGVLAAALAAGLLLLRARRGRIHKYPDHSPSLLRRDSSSSCHSACILLAYNSGAADHGRRLALAFAETGAQVVDLQSPQCVSACAAAPAAFLRAQLAAPRTRLVLLLYPRESERMTFGDSLVKYCVQHVADSLHAHTHARPYDKYFVATLAGSEHVLPHMLPLSRYVLPAALPALLLHTTGHTHTHTPDHDDAYVVTCAADRRQPTL